jgi:hypothetical protein
MAETEPDLTRVASAALRLQEFCQERAWRFCFIGGLALQAWSAPRLTLDADITLLTGFSGEEDYIDALLGAFNARMPDAREFALRNRVLLLTSHGEVGIDVSLGALPFEERSVGRAVMRLVSRGCLLRVCSAEDLVIHKAFASRDQDWADVDGILMRQSSALDTSLIFDELRPLAQLKQDDTIVSRLEHLMRKRGVLK